MVTLAGGLGICAMAARYASIDTAPPGPAGAGPGDAGTAPRFLEPEATSRLKLDLAVVVSAEALFILTDLDGGVEGRGRENHRAFG